jgi:uncharacterized ferritin-like protein (DUF455 family)
MSYPTNLNDFGVLILNTPETEDKAKLTFIAYDLFNKGQLEILPQNLDERMKPPDSPARPKDVKVVDPKLVSERKTSTSEGRIALIHSLCHMESYAIDLSWDILCRFSDLKLPKEFFEDWLQVAEDESRHFGWLSARLKELNSFYGDLPTHGGLWQAASKTSHDLCQRLVILHCVHEARGLDTTPKNIERLKSAQDPKSAKLLVDITREEISHVKYGLKWYEILSRDLFGCKDKEEQMALFHKTVRTYFKNPIKGPFNVEAREQAGMGEEWYLPLTEPEKKPDLEK